jgi:hypothetical protein
MTRRILAGSDGKANLIQQLLGGGYIAIGLDLKLKHITPRQGIFLVNCNILQTRLDGGNYLQRIGTP